MSPPSKPDFDAVYARLRDILRACERGGLKPHSDQSSGYELIGPMTPTSRGKDVWFGAVQIKKNYVSYYLMPVYAFPDLLADISPALKKRMQGKSCFNFTHLDEPLFQELAALTERGFERYRQAGMVK